MGEWMTICKSWERAEAMVREMASAADILADGLSVKAEYLQLLNLARNAAIALDRLADAMANEASRSGEAQKESSKRGH